ncbi:MAG: hypothetical protein M3508_12660, partial [Actinomycetota bacterium]|nr:hypothetical protein [Actinomycetota bacterium]
MLAASLNGAIGRAGLLLILAASVSGALSTAYAVRRGDTRLARQSRWYAVLILLGAVVAVAM